MFRTPVALMLSLLAQFGIALSAQSQTIQPGTQFSASSQSPQAAQLALSMPAQSASLGSLRSNASLFLASSQWVAAADAYRRLIQLGSAEATDRYALGDALYHAKDLPNAAAAFEQAIVINPKLDRCYSRLAETYLAMRQPAQARRVCLNALQVVSDSFTRQQIENLMRVATFEQKPPTRSHEIRPDRMPAES